MNVPEVCQALEALHAALQKDDAGHHDVAQLQRLENLGHIIEAHARDLRTVAALHAGGNGDRAIHIEEAATMMGMPVNRAYRLAANDEFPFAWKEGKRWCFSLQGTEAWILQRRNRR